MFDDDDDDVIDSAYDRGYEEGQGNTGFFDFVRRGNHAAALREAAHKKGLRDGKAALMAQVGDVTNDDDDDDDMLDEITEDGF